MINKIIELKSGFVCMYVSKHNGVCAGGKFDSVSLVDDVLTFSYNDGLVLRIENDMGLCEFEETSDGEYMWEYDDELYVKVISRK